MDFDYTEEHEKLRQKVRRFAEEELAPSANIRDEEESFNRGLMFDRLRDLGLTGLVFPQHYGGLGKDYICYAIAVEELSRVCASTGVTLSAHLSLGANPIYLFGSEQQKEEYLIPLAKGVKMGAFGLTEPSAGSDAGGTRTTAVKQGDCWVVNGAKIFITNAHEADVYIIFARTDLTAKRHHGMSCFIVEKGMAGFEFGKKERKMGIRSSATGELLFQDCKIPQENLLGKEGKGFGIAMKTLDGGRIGIGAQALGIAQGTLEMATEYTKKEVKPTNYRNSFQPAQSTLADMATQTEAARLMVYRAAFLAGVGKQYSREAAMAKLYASKIAMEVTSQAVQILGGHAFFDSKYPVERMMRDAKITEIYEGTSEIQRLVIGAALMK